ncbi:MarR family winged helix-turn-helix transcriptional regulator [Deinococcus maricopensis]|uniref:Regulatory protein MarR n=1 Tax=Deinococcus maricopensis (strain DSM 21211 / LMG 22137 / NRRL B-23946 / LB-34) TaxID=709986 RepID=E8U6X0_DEIML|nr:MarR family winged helix-turn-helix transcriptional regulator [Deinococcus maricopensis]ADV66809.1 regulatory protein MarR [Deinococcus maricopensis DSM 21211]
MNAPPQHDPALQFLSAYWLVYRALAERIEDHLNAHVGLDLRDFMALSHLQNPDYTTPSALARALHLPRYVISRTLDTLTRAGAVTHTADPRDARRLHYTLTPHGTHLLTLGFDLVRTLTNPLLDELGPDAPHATRTLERLLGLAAHLPTPKETA